MQSSAEVSLYHDGSTATKTTMTTTKLKSRVRLRRCCENICIVILVELLFHLVFRVMTGTHFHHDWTEISSSIIGFGSNNKITKALKATKTRKTSSSLVSVDCERIPDLLGALIDYYDVDKNKNRNNSLENHPNPEGNTTLQQQQQQEQLLRQLLEQEQWEDLPSHPKRAITAIRRTLFGSDKPCFQRHLPLFESYFWKYSYSSSNRQEQRKQKQRHLNLHIPKTGGTSLCQLVKKQLKAYYNLRKKGKKANSKMVMTTAGGNCWFQSFCPVWCCCSFTPEQLLFQRQQHKKQQHCMLEKVNDTQIKTIDFVMNENYFRGFCNLDEKYKYAGLNYHRMYSILIRDPVSRAKSHINHFLNGFYPGYAKRLEEYKRRKTLNMTQLPPPRWFEQELNETLQWFGSNYMTWSLVASEAAEKLSVLDPVQYRPNPKDVPRAVAIVKQMDYIIDITNSDLPRQCLADTFELMGLSSKSSVSSHTATAENPSNNTNKEQPLEHHRKSDYNASNQNKARHSTTITSSLLSIEKKADERQLYRSWNPLDQEVYDQAIQFLHGDCKFFRYLLRHG